MMNIIWAIIWFLVLGLGFGIILSVVNKFFKFEIDPKIEVINNLLPSANCGGCGHTGCIAFAEAVVNGKAKTNACPAIGDEITAKIAEIMGEQSLPNVRYRAAVMCSGTNDFARAKYEYDGIADCISANRLAWGSKACQNGCLGLGTCVKKCKFDAIKLVNGIAVIDYEKCAACGVCVIVCPKMIIKLIPFNAAHWVGCVSSDNNKVTRKNCDVGCIACGLCVKKCPVNAISINDFTAVIDYEKCTNCGDCEKACPRRVIWSGVSQKNEGIVRDKESALDE